MDNVLASRTMAALAADIPFHDFFCLNVVVHGVAAITGGAGGALHIVGRIERFPPVRSFGYKIGAPDVMGDVPLCGLRKIVIANFGAVALLPDAAVDERS